MRNILKVVATLCAFSASQQLFSVTIRQANPDDVEAIVQLFWIKLCSKSSQTPLGHQNCTFIFSLLQKPLTDSLGEIAQGQKDDNSENQNFLFVAEDCLGNCTKIVGALACSLDPKQQILRIFNPLATEQSIKVDLTIHVMTTFHGRYKSVGAFLFNVLFDNPFASLLVEF